MCLVIDTCCLALVFEPKSKAHAHFRPVFNWVNTGRGRVIYGGTKYFDELGRAAKFIPIIAELERRGRAILVDNVRVDAAAQKARDVVDDDRFDDEHLVALVIVSRCCVVCTSDKKAIPFLKQRELYAPYRLKPPRIYQNKIHKTLCCDKYTVPICRGRR